MISHGNKLLRSIKHKAVIFQIACTVWREKKTIPNRSNKREKRLLGIKRYLGGDKLIPLHYCAVKIFVLYILNPIM